MILSCCCCGSDDADKRGIAPRPLPATNILLPPPGHQLPAQCANKEELRRMRAEFWQTAPAYGGQDEVWAALRDACESNDSVFASAVCASLGIVTPRGSLTEAYDERGHKYEIPAYCLYSPAPQLSDKQKNGRSNGRKFDDKPVKITLRFANKIGDKKIMLKSTAPIGELIPVIPGDHDFKEVLFFHQGQGPLDIARLVGEFIDEHATDRILFQVMLR